MYLRNSVCVSSTLEAIDLEPELAGRLMELGFLPGVTVSQGCCAPSGDPRVFRVDGSEVALRRETYERIAIRPRYSAAFA